MERVLVVVALLGLAGAAAAVVRRRTTPDAPTQSSWTVPAQLDRDDFDHPDAAWLVAVFSSATCLSCRATWAKAEQLASPQVAVQEVEAVAHPALHDRYGIDAVPCVVVADVSGVVRASFLGEPSTADLWAAVAELREPGSTPPSCTGSD
ncbi:MAG: hypothetical protein WKF43_03110 [Acidimicrobiales bacterium]